MMCTWPVLACSKPGEMPLAGVCLWLSVKATAGLGLVFVVLTGSSLVTPSKSSRKMSSLQGGHDGDVGSAAFRGLPKWASGKFEERLLIDKEAKTSLFELPHADEHGVGQVRDK